MRLIKDSKQRSIDSIESVMWKLNLVERACKLLKYILFGRGDNVEMFLNKFNKTSILIYKTKISFRMK